MASSKYVYGVGEIILRKDECFWILPRTFISSKEATWSPWFSYMGDKWRLVTLQRFNEDYKVYDIIFRLWKKSRSSPSKNKHIVHLSLKTKCRNDCIVKTGEIDSDYGCEFLFPYYHSGCGHPFEVEHIFSRNEFVKLLFDIQKKESIDNITEKDDEEASSEVNREDSDEYEDSSDEENNHDEMNSADEGCSKNENATTELKGIQKLAENLKQALLDKELSDVVLKVEDREFNVHKIILAARSSVFASMFKHDLSEKNTNEVNIPDCTAESFEVFLHYLYRGSIENMSKSNVWNLYYAADKYQVDDLKKKCVKFMKKSLSVETFCDAIALSLRHGESKLQKAATDFFRENIKKVLKSVQWQKFMAENPTHANELLIKAHNA